MMSLPIIVLTGPTASGKSALAIAQALRWNGEIINADSMQIYQGLPLLTAAPSKADQEQIPHHLYGVLSPSQVGSVAWWTQEALKVIEDIVERQKVPIVVGGTGLYLKSLLEGLCYVPSISEEVRQKVRQKAQDLSQEAFYREVLAKDPVLAARIGPTDKQRLMRILEVMEETGQSLGIWQATPPPSSVAEDNRFQVKAYTIALCPPRPLLYDRINGRFLQMVEAGAVEEVAAFLETHPSSQSPLRKALGVPQLQGFLEGKGSLEEAVLLAQQSSRHYAKRQLTWIRHQLSLDQQIESLEEMGEIQEAKIRQFLFAEN